MWRHCPGQGKFGDGPVLESRSGSRGTPWLGLQRVARRIRQDAANRAVARCLRREYFCKEETGIRTNLNPGAVNVLIL